MYLEHENHTIEIDETTKVVTVTAPSMTVSISAAGGQIVVQSAAELESSRGRSSDPHNRYETVLDVIQ